MKKIELFERAIEERGKSLSEYGINNTVFRAYTECFETENEMLDFSEVIWEEDIEEIVKFMKTHGIEKFTISSTFSGLIKTLAKLEEQNIKISGMTQVRARYTDIFTKEKAIIPAIVMTVC